MSDFTLPLIVAALFFLYRLPKRLRSMETATRFGLGSTLSATCEIAITLIMGYVIVHAKSDFSTGSIIYYLLAGTTYVGLASSLWACLVLWASGESTLEASDKTVAERESKSTPSALLVPCSVYVASIFLSIIESTDLANRV